MDMNFEVVNIVADFRLKSPLNLLQVARDRSISFEPKRSTFAKAALPGGGTALFHANGRVVISGVRSEEAVRASTEWIRTKLASLGIESQASPVRFLNYVAVAELNGPIELSQLARQYESVEYEPETFPAGIERLASGPVIMYYSTGKVVLTGIRRLADVGPTVAHAERVATAL